MKKTFLKRRMVEITWIFGIAAVLSYLNWQIDHSLGSVASRMISRVIFFSSITVISWFIFTAIFVAATQSKPTDSQFYQFLFKYKWPAFVTAMILVSLFSGDDFSAAGISLDVMKGILAAFLAFMLIYALNTFRKFLRPGKKTPIILYEFYLICIFLALFTVTVMGVNYFDPADDGAGTNIFSGLGVGILLVLWMVAFAIGGVYLLLLMVKRIVLAFGIHLGGWGGDRSLDRFIAARQRQLAGTGGSPLARSRAQILLGMALGEFGRRNGDADAFRRSAEAFRAALPALQQTGKTSQWALTQSNLATALYHLNRHEVDRLSLEGAVEALRAGAEAWNSLDGYVSDWANAQFQLCGVLTRLGILEDGAARLAEAVAIGQAALAAEDHSFAPLGAAKLQINLSEALAYLGEREDGSGTFEEAVATARNALRIIDEDKDDLLKEEESIEWRTLLLGNLGHALRCLGERRANPDSLREAADALRTGSQLRGRNNAFDSAIVQDELARTLRLLGEHDPEPDLLSESLSASDSALKTLTRRTYPLDWAVAATARAETLTTIGARTRDAVALKQAVDALTEALAVFEQAEVPVQTRMCREILDRATVLLDDLVRGGAGGESTDPSPGGLMKPRPA